jgi:hypothetical protein
VNVVVVPSELVDEMGIPYPKVDFVGRKTRSVGIEGLMCLGWNTSQT